MTVAELMKELGRMPQDLKVTFDKGDQSGGEENVEVDEVFEATRYGWINTNTCGRRSVIVLGD